VNIISSFAQNIADGAKWIVRPARIQGRHMMSFGSTRLPLSAVSTVCALILLVLYLDVRPRSAALVWWIDGGAIQNAKLLPNWLVMTFNHLTDFGKSGWVLFPAGIALLVIALIASIVSLSRMNRLVLASIAIRLEFLFLAVAIPGIVTNIIKRLFGRARPFIGGDADVYLPFDMRAAYASLPSGHSTAAFSILVALGALFPAWRPYLLIYAVFIGVSRVVVLAHHPSDVLAGAVVGTFGALMVLTWFAVRQRGFVLDSKGGVRVMAGPGWQRIKTVAGAVRGQ
jgi:membrane-associated phospholipid phosphatase